MYPRRLNLVGNYGRLLLTLAVGAVLATGSLVVPTATPAFASARAVTISGTVTDAVTAAALSSVTVTGHCVSATGIGAFCSPNTTTTTNSLGFYSATINWDG